MFGMCKAKYISDGFRMRAGPEALKTLSNLKLDFCFLFRVINFLLFWGALGAMVPWCQSGAIIILESAFGRQLVLLPMARNAWVGGSPGFRHANACRNPGRVLYMDR